MNKTIFAAILSIGVLLLGTVATVYEVVPNAHAVKAKGTFLKDIVGKPNRHREYSKVCGDELCTSIKDASTGLRKAQIGIGPNKILHQQ